MEVRLKHPQAICVKSGDGCGYYVWDSGMKKEMLGRGQSSASAWAGVLSDSFSMNESGASHSAQMETHANQIIVRLDVAANKATPALASMIARILADAGATVSFGDDRCDNLEAKAVKSLDGLHVHIGKLTWAHDC